MADEKKRIAIINQRYGLEVNGGSEYYTRQLAEHLTSLYQVEVLTTKALGYDSWEDYYKQDTEAIHGVLVRRFGVSRLRNKFQMRVAERLRRYCPIWKDRWENRWIDAQGPYSPGLIQYIAEHRNDYTVFLFVTYLYYHTVRGLPQVADRAVLLPTAHDEPYIYFDIYKRIFSQSKAIIYLTPEEKLFVESLFPVKEKPSCICGSGVDVPDQIDNGAYREKYGVSDKYVIYVGRIDPCKGCDEMFRIFRAYKEQHPDSALKLVLMGKAVMEVPQADDILYQGFVSEEDKFNGISGAMALWLPSRYESLSIAVLEAMSLGVPVMVNGNCEVLKGHCERSGGGRYYCDFEDALQVLKVLSVAENRQAMSKRAVRYVKENYQWDRVAEKINSLLTQLQRD